MNYCLNVVFYTIEPRTPMQAYDAWADEQTQRDMQRREEVNINHSHRHDEQDDVEIGGNF